MKLNSLLQQAFPLNTSFKKELLNALLFGLFIFLFLLIFQPFGINNFKSENKTLYFVGYGLITGGIMLVNHQMFKLLFLKWFNEKTWTVGKNIVYVLWIIFCIGLGNLLFSAYIGFVELTMTSLLTYQMMTLVIGIIPVAVSTLVIYHNKLKRALTQAKDLNSSIKNHKKEIEKTVLIPSKNKAENLSVNSNQLLFIKAEENYVQIYTENLPTCLPDRQAGKPLTNTCCETP